MRLGNWESLTLQEHTLLMTWLKWYHTMVYGCYSRDVPVFQDRISSSGNHRVSLHCRIKQIIIWPSMQREIEWYRVVDGSSQCPTFFTLLGKQSWSWSIHSKNLLSKHIIGCQWRKLIKSPFKQTLTFSKQYYILPWVHLLGDCYLPLPQLNLVYFQLHCLHPERRDFLIKGWYKFCHFS